VYLTMANQQALAQLRGLWCRWRDDPDAVWEWGHGAWAHVFPSIREIRPWSAEDRIRDTGLEEVWQSRLAAGEERVRFEVELWFRGVSGTRQRAATTVWRAVEQAGGEILKTSEIPEIRYHALLGSIPSASAASILRHEAVQLLQADDVMFLRPSGQVSAPSPPPDTPREASPALERPMPGDAPPVVAVLDGMPLEGHELLDGRILTHDPEGWAESIEQVRRYHGTAIASLVVHGDLGASEPPLTRRVYVRPVLKPHALPGGVAESIPEDELPVDLVHRAVREIFDGEEPGGGAAPSVRIINLSIGDGVRIFHSALSPWAKLLDWLAHRYRVLFIISAGNHPRPITLAMARGTVVDADPHALQAAVLDALIDDARNRRLLAPAEAVNAISVGALHRDASTEPLLAGYHVDPLSDSSLPSPLNAHGLGYRRAIKPEILMPGGRQIYEEPPVGDGDRAVLQPIGAPFAAPGQLTAAPGTRPGELNRVLNCRGTSNAAALATRTAAQLYEVIEGLRAEPGGELLEEAFAANLLKTLLVHGAAWGDAEATWDAALRPRFGGQKLREHISRFLGYGAVVPGYASSCTDQRVTLIGCGTLADGGAHTYSLPLPPSLSGQAVLRRVVITLAWLSPVTPGTQKYRRAHLWFKPARQEEIAPKRASYDHMAVSRGTVQHEVFLGEKAAIFADGDSIDVQVNCREDAPGLKNEAVPYGLAVTLEVAEGVGIPIYEEVRAKVRRRVGVRART
jgi:hypothetical protein